MERVVPVQGVPPKELASEDLRIAVTARCPCYNLSGYSLSLWPESKPLSARGAIV
jgi:hypothetical protein